MLNILSGGFLSGYRTYLLGGMIALQAIVNYLVGDISLTALFAEAPQILGGLGFMSLRASVANN